MDVKSISVEVTSKGLRPAANALGELAKAAGTAAPVIAEATKQLDNLSNASLGSIVAQLSTAANGINRLKVSTKDMSNTGQSFKGLSTATSNIANAMEKLVASTNGLVGFNEQLAKTRDILNEMKGSASVLSSVGRSAASATVSSGGSSGGSGGSETDALTKKQQALLRQIEYTTVYTEKGRAGLLEYRAAQLGVSNAAAPMIDRLKKAGTTLNDGTISVKQYNSAMRMIPAQFTDVATQLAGGQNPLLILLQQGGQIKDMFGGSVPQALKATGSYLAGLLTNPLLLAAAAAAGLGYAMYSSMASLNDFQKGIRATGNYAGMTVSSFNELTDAVGASTGSFGKTQDTITALASAGIFTNKEIENLTATIVNTSRLTGESVDKIVDKYAALKEKPLSAIQELNKGTNFLTAEVWSSINALTEQGKTTEAAAVAMKALQQYQDELAGNTEKNLPKTISLWQKFKDSVSGIGAEIEKTMRGFGTSDIDQLLVKYKNMLDVQEALASRGRYGAAEEAANIRGLIKGLEDQKKATQDAADAQAKATQDRAKTLSIVEDLTKQQDQLKSSEEKRATEIDKIKNRYAELRVLSKAVTDDDFNQYLAKNKLKTETEAIAQAQEKYKDKVKNTGVEQLSTLTAELEAIKQNIAGYESQGASYDKLTENAKKLLSIEAQLANPATPKEKVANLQSQRAELTQIVALEKTQNDLQESAKRQKTYEEQTKSAAANLKALQERSAALGGNVGVSSTLSETDKKLALAQDDLTRATTKHEQASLAAYIAVLKEVSAEEQSVKSKEAVKKIEEENAKTRETSKAQYDALVAKYSQEQDALKYSSVQLEKLNAVRQIEAETAKKVAEVQAQINVLKAQEGTDNSGQISALEERIKVLQETKDKMVGLTNSQPDYKQLFGESSLGDMKVGFDNFYNSLSNSQSVYQSGFQQGYSLMSSTLSTFFKTGEFDAKEWAANMLSYVADVVAQLLVLKAIQATVGAFSGASGAADAGASAGYSASAGMTAYAKGGAFDSRGVTAYAKGGAFSNSVLTKPTYFASGGTFGSSLNVAGEAGPEAVMPLTRDSQGNLAVSATGASGGSIQVNVTVNSDGSSSSSTSGMDEGQLKQIGSALGDKIRQVIITEKRPGGLLAG